jgi:hypothetical protein
MPAAPEGRRKIVLPVQSGHLEMAAAGYLKARRQRGFSFVFKSANIQLWTKLMI